MAGKSFHCSVVTPEQQVLDCAATFVAFPSHDGEVGVLPNRAPLLHRMGVGRLRVDVDGGERREFLVVGGFAQMSGDRLTLLSEQAVPVAELSRERGEAALAEALAMPAEDEAAATARRRAQERARAELRLARG